MRQDVFSVWSYKKDQRSIRDLRFKSQTRHVFLYERLVVFCKKKDDAASNTYKPTTYKLKNSLPVRPLFLIRFRFYSVFCIVVAPYITGNMSVLNVEILTVCSDGKLENVGIRFPPPTVFRVFFTYLFIMNHTPNNILLAVWYSKEPEIQLAADFDRNKKYFGVVGLEDWRKSGRRHILVYLLITFC